jgi:hypothetical protein
MRGKQKKSVSAIVVVANLSGTFHNEFQALAMQQPAELPFK